MTAPCHSVAPLSPEWSKRQKDLPSTFWGALYKGPCLSFPAVQWGEGL